MSRADLLILTPDALSALTNRGLLKRATAAVASGERPQWSTEDDDTLIATLADGTVTRLPTTGIAAATCTCGAATTCRHVLIAVLAYQAAETSAPGAEQAPKVEPSTAGWSPSAFTDDELTAHVGARAMDAARRRFSAGYSARVTRAGSDGTEPRVDLPACTVRFLVPGQLSFARSDAAAGVLDEAVALAVWAFRVADATAPAEPSVLVQVGARTDVTASALADAVELAADVILDGAVHIGAGLTPRIAATRRAMEAENLRWPVLTLDEIEEQLSAYGDRHAGYRPERLAELLAEMHARHRAVASHGASPASEVLGTSEAPETPLRLLRLTSLGARVTSRSHEQSVDVFLADAGSGMVFVLRHRWSAEVDAPPVRADALSRRRIGSGSLGDLAAANLVTESAVRSASRRLRLASSRVARTTISPSAGAWSSLPPPLLVRDLAQLSESMERLPPRMIRPRVDAESVYAVEIAEVAHVSYSPGAQRLTASVVDGHGSVATIAAAYRSDAPTALDTLATALAAGPRYVSGIVHRSRGGLIIDPIAVVAGDRVIVPDLAGHAGAAVLPYPDTATAESAHAAVDRALSLLADVTHHGARHLSTAFGDRLRRSGHDLESAGLARAAEAMTALAATLGPAPGTATVTSWVNAAIRLLTTAERR